MNKSFWRAPLPFLEKPFCYMTKLKNFKLKSVSYQFDTIFLKSPILILLIRLTRYITSYDRDRSIKRLRRQPARLFRRRHRPLVFHRSTWISHFVFSSIIHWLSWESKLKSRRNPWQIHKKSIPMWRNLRCPPFKKELAYILLPKKKKPISVLRKKLQKMYPLPHQRVLSPLIHQKIQNANYWHLR